MYTVLVGACQALLTVSCDLTQARAAELEAKEKDLELKKQALAKAIAELEASYEELNSKMAEAHAALKELKTGEAGLGAVWWMERQL